MNARPRDSSLSSFRWIRLAKVIGKKIRNELFWSTSRFAGSLSLPRSGSVSDYTVRFVVEKTMCILRVTSLIYEYLFACPQCRPVGCDMWWHWGEISQLFFSFFNCHIRPVGKDEMCEDIFDHASGSYW